MDESQKIYQLKVELQGSDIPVWRRIRISGYVSLWHLHVAIQSVTSGSDSESFHGFAVPDDFDEGQTVRYGDATSDDPDVEIAHSWAKYVDQSFFEIGDTVHYDAGLIDEREYMITLEAIFSPEEGASYPQCVDGAGVFVPGCLDVDDQNWLINAYFDPDNPDHDEARAELGDTFDPTFFDPKAVKFHDPVRYWRRVYSTASVDGNFDISELEYFLDDDEPGWGVDLYILDLGLEFLGSPEGQGWTERIGERAGRHVDQFLTVSFRELHSAPTLMSSVELSELLVHTYPRLVPSRTVPDATEIIDVLAAFWRFLHARYGLETAPEILEVLDEVRPDFDEWMRDESRWGLGKSFVVAAERAGYDVTDPEQCDAFMHIYSDALLDKIIPGGDGSAFHHSRPAVPGAKRKSTSKKKRKMAKASRKKNRRK